MLYSSFPFPSTTFTRIQVRSVLGQGRRAWLPHCQPLSLGPVAHLAAEPAEMAEASTWNPGLGLFCLGVSLLSPVTCTSSLSGEVAGRPAVAQVSQEPVSVLEGPSLPSCDKYSLSKEGPHGARGQPCGSEQFTGTEEPRGHARVQGSGGGRSERAPALEPGGVHVRGVPARSWRVAISAAGCARKLRAPPAASESHSGRQRCRPPSFISPRFQPPELRARPARAGSSAPIAPSLCSSHLQEPMSRL